MIVLVLQATSCIGTSILFLVLASDNMQLLLGDYLGFETKTAYLVLVTAVALPFCYFRTLDDVGLVRHCTCAVHGHGDRLFGTGHGSAAPGCGLCLEQIEGQTLGLFHR